MDGLFGEKIGEIRFKSDSMMIGSFVDQNVNRFVNDLGGMFNNGECINKDKIKNKQNEPYY